MKTKTKAKFVAIHCRKCGALLAVVNADLTHTKAYCPKCRVWSGVDSGKMKAGSSS